MKSLAVKSLYSWFPVVAAMCFAIPVSAQHPGDRQPLNQLPPIVTPDGKLSNSHLKRDLFLPPIVQGSDSQSIASPNSQPLLKNPGNLPPIVQGNSSKTQPKLLQPQPQLHHPAPPVMVNQKRDTPLPAVVGRSNPMANSQMTNVPFSIPKVSASGVPIYPEGKNPVSNIDFAVKPEQGVGQVGFNGNPNNGNPNRVFQGSGTRNPIDAGNLANPFPPIVTPDSLSPGIQEGAGRVPGTLTPQDPSFGREIMRNPQMVAPSTVMESPLTPQTNQRSIAAPEIAAPVDPDSMASPGIVSPTMPGTNDYFSNPPQPTVSGGQVVESGCSSCGPGGCYDLNQVQSQFGCCGSVASAGYYGFFDGLVWTRGDGDIQFSNFFGLNNFSYEGGFRITLGYRQNATRGRELTYFGTGDIDDNEIRTSSINSLAPTFGISTTFGLGNVNGFTTAGRHEHSKSTSIHSLEYNRVNWGWDVLKSMIGIRYLYFDDNTRFFSTNGLTGQNGLLTMDSVNNLFGVQGGFEAFYDVGYRTSFSLTTKGGAYINSANMDTNLFNFGSQALSQDTDDASIASSIEIGVLSHFQLRPQARFRLGYDVMLLWGLFTIENNAPRDTFANGNQTGVAFLSPLTGTDLNTNNEVVVFHGLSFGFEFYR